MSGGLLAGCAGSSLNWESSACELDLRWFLVLTKPSGESTAKTNVERQGYRVYYPGVLRPSLHRGRWIERIVSLFPRCLFIQLDATWQSLSPVRSTLGVANIVRFGVESTLVPDAIVDGLLRHADPRSGLHKISSAEPFEPGTRVDIIAGAFEGLEGISFADYLGNTFALSSTTCLQPSPLEFRLFRG